MTKGYISTLSHFFRDEHKLSLSVGKKLKSYLDENFDLHHNGKAFVFNQASKQRFREEIEELYSDLNIRQGLPKGLDRISVLSYIQDDKLADEKPNDNFVLATTYNGKLRVYDHDIVLPKGASLRLPLAGVDKTSFDTFIVVENLDIFDNWHLASISPKLQNALVLYRGHDSISKGLKALLENLGGDTDVIMCPDLDPKGIENCFTTPRVNCILAPSIEDIQTRLSQNSQMQNKFVNQQDSVKYLKKQECGAWQSLISHLIGNNLAIMQQASFALKLPLVVYRR